MGLRTFGAHEHHAKRQRSIPQSEVQLTMAVDSISRLYVYIYIYVCILYIYKYSHIETMDDLWWFILYIYICMYIYIYIYMYIYIYIGGDWLRENHRKTIGKLWFNGIWWNVYIYIFKHIETLDDLWYMIWKTIGKPIGKP